MNYDEQIEKLFCRFPSYQVVGSRAYKPGLETMLAIDEAMGHPHTSFKTIHVAGTNGKGSVCHMLAASLSQCGLKVGLYSSPHLVDFRERMKVIDSKGCRLISKEAVSSFLDKWNELFDKLNPSFFEITTAMAFCYFAEEQVDYAIIETGLGGRLDSTNIITPELSIITNIGLEHCKYLGNTLEEIAFEKGGIIKKGVPVVIGERHDKTAPVFEKITAEKGAKLAYSYDLSVVSQSNYINCTIDLPGAYQAENVRIVLCSLKQLRISGPNIMEGICHTAAITHFRGRWEKIDLGKGRPHLICDIGHNAHALKYIFPQIEKAQESQVWIVFGMVSDKDVEAVAHFMTKPSERFHYIFTQASTNRALPVDTLASRLAPFSISGQTTKTIAEALHLALSEASANDLIFVGGSNFTVADAIIEIEKLLS